METFVLAVLGHAVCLNTFHRSNNRKVTNYMLYFPFLSTLNGLYNGNERALHTPPELQIAHSAGAVEYTDCTSEEV